MGLSSFFPTLCSYWMFRIARFKVICRSKVGHGGGEEIKKKRLRDREAESRRKSKKTEFLGKPR